MECPVYPTELLFALDVSQDTKPQLFERMREIIIAIVNDTKIRDSNCPVGARVAVVSYSSSTQHLIRFSDFHTKDQLLQELKALPYQRSTDRRDIGGSMRFVARNIFKRTLQGANMRKVAVFFSNGQSSNPLSINTAVLEFSALGIVPVVIAFKSIPEVNHAFAIDYSGQFQIIDVPGQGDYKSPLHQLQLCTICYDKCELSAECEHTRRVHPPQEYVDVAFIFDNSQTTSRVEFEKMKDFLSKALDNLDVSSEPATSSVGDRVAVVSYATPTAFQLQTPKAPVKTEFDLVTYSSTQLMKEHIRESIHQLNGGAAVGRALQWTINHIFSDAPRPRKHKAVIVISAGETSYWDKEVLKKVSLRAKCQGYALWVLSLGQAYNRPELEELASPPLEQHLIQLGRIHKPELEYAVMFLKSFLRFLRRLGMNISPKGLLRL
ncbi:hypothetical protein lerEdw1_020218 [Lerista edwardsae]|nr:hypothetical protein lerEdw1_020218 [Lerista edwardsae]